jgi:hypothetical protein
MKRIVIKYNGPIYPKAGVYGPIDIPYLEDHQTIFALLVQNYPVYEVLDNGEELRLTIANFEADNNAPVKVLSPVEEVVTEEVAVVEEVQEEAAAAPSQQKFGKKRPQLDTIEKK